MVGRFGTQADELACYDRWGWNYDLEDVPKRPGGRDIPRYVRGVDNHYDAEADAVESLLLMYLRTGSRAFFDSCEAYVNYYVDLRSWRTDGWRFKDGGVWWTTGGPLGNRPQRGPDPVLGLHNRVPAPWSSKLKPPILKDSARDLSFLANSKTCNCHNWGAGLPGWYCITGDHDVLEATIDDVEQNIDTQRRAFRVTPGQASSFSRAFNRSLHAANATRMVVPRDPFVVDASDYLARVFLERPTKEARGLVNAGQPSRRPIDLKKYVGDRGIAEMNRLGVTLDIKTGLMRNPRTGLEWFVIPQPNSFQLPWMSGAMEAYYRLTDNEDAMDWVIAYGQSVCHVLWQSKHGQQHKWMLADFPLRGVVKDVASWELPEDSKTGGGYEISGYLARFLPDVAARAYSLCGEPMLKQRAYDYWYYGSHRGYWATEMHNLGGVGMWVNYYQVNNEQVCFTGRNFYEWAHPRADSKPPRTVTDLKVKLEGDGAQVSFTAPADEGGREVARYQVKCADKPIVEYREFLEAYAANKDGGVRNWWMATNVKGEPTPQRPGRVETFTVTGIPAGVRYFAVRSFDDSNNRSAQSNVADAGG